MIFREAIRSKLIMTDVPEFLTRARVPELPRCEEGIESNAPGLDIRDVPWNLAVLESCFNFAKEIQAEWQDRIAFAEIF